MKQKYLGGKIKRKKKKKSQRVQIHNVTVCTETIIKDLGAQCSALADCYHSQELNEMQQPASAEAVP